MELELLPSTQNPPVYVHRRVWERTKEREKKLKQENRQQHNNGDHDPGTDGPYLEESLIGLLMRRIIHAFRGRVYQFAMI